MSFHPHAPAPPKRPIPRLRKTVSAGAVPSKHRVPRACLSCRARKVKCNGEHPTCQSCREQALRCVYVSSRKDKLKTATDHNVAMARLLRELRAHVAEPHAQRIADLLDDVCDDVAEAAAAVGSPLRPAHFDHDDERDASTSSHDPDMMDEDSLRNDESRATGYVGKNSDVQMMRRLHHHADQPADYGPASRHAALQPAASSAAKDTTPLGQTSNYNFYLDDEELDVVAAVDPFELPPLETAERLVRCYLDTVQNSFPLLEKRKFVAELYQHYNSVNSGNGGTLSEKSQGMLNLVFAIGAVHSHLTEAAWHPHARDHVIYHSRAWSLVLKDPWWFSHPDLYQLQLTGLLSLYYWTIGHVSRSAHITTETSWVVSGMALRQGYALGLHLRNEDPAVTAVEKELRGRMWWGVYSLECSLSTITGRPSAGLEHHCSVPSPLPLSAEEMDEAIIVSRFGDRHIRENRPLNLRMGSHTDGRPHDVTMQMSEPANSGSYLKNTIKINMLSATALTDLYSASTVTKSWENVQKSIGQLLHRLEGWAQALPPGLNFLVPNTSPDYQQERTTLELHYYSTKILISRPCLCRTDRHVVDQSHDSDDFNRTTADICVGAAKAIAALLPDNADQVGMKMYQFMPWWSMVHFLMQAVSTLLLDIFFAAKEFPRDRLESMTSLKKLLRCLRAMGVTNASAIRAYNIAFKILNISATNLQLDISDFQTEEAVYYAPAPPPHHVKTEPGPAVYSQPYNLTYQYMPQPPAPYAYNNPRGEAGFFIPSWGGDSASSTTQHFADYNPNPSPCNTFPNLFVTPYDEHNPLPGPGVGVSGGEVHMADYFSTPQFVPHPSARV